MAGTGGKPVHDGGSGESPSGAAMIVSVVLYPGCTVCLAWVGKHDEQVVSRKEA